MSLELPPDYEDFKAEVLADQASDSQGLYEVWWSANSRYPSLALGVRLSIAEAVVRDLIRESRVRLVEGRWIGPEFDRQHVVDIDEALRDWATWVPPPDRSVVWMDR